MVGALLAQAPLEFEWTAPAGCPPAEVVRARLRPVSGVASATVTERGTSMSVRR
ncbi:MAG: hypothetical protein SFW67_08420 [Myxococcaceae bacterium]|nr:hypothetical protein [Myxococcaceae bacterium]